MKSLWNVNLVIDDLSFPVSLYSGIKDSQPKFVQIDIRDNNRIRLSRLNAETFEELDGLYLGKAYQDGDRLIPVPGEFLAGLKPPKSDSLVFNSFVAPNSIPAVFYESFYFLAPQAGFEAQYASLLSSLSDSRLLGISEGFFRNLSHLFALSTYDGSLILYSLRFPAQILRSEESALPLKRASISQLNSDLNDRLTESSLPFDPSLYSDSYAEHLVGAILTQLAPAA